MYQRATVTMGMRELDRLKVIQAVVDGELRAGLAAERLGRRHYERKLYVLVDTPANRRLIGKYVEVFQYPDGRIEIRVAGRALPYSLYINSGRIDQGAIVENKRLGHALQVLQAAQARREPLRRWAPSTAHRADGAKVARSKRVSSRKPRTRQGLEPALEAVGPELLPPLTGRQTARRERLGK
jgi:hypothetical protein